MSCGVSSSENKVTILSCSVVLNSGSKKKELIFVDREARCVNFRWREMEATRRARQVAMQQNQTWRQMERNCNSDRATGLKFQQRATLEHWA